MTPIRVRHLPLRVTTGAFILASGLDKWRADEQAAAGLHGFASGTYPVLKELPPQQFARAVSVAEITLGTALLAAPVVPAGLAGAALVGFASGLLGLYLRTPGMRREGSLRPTEQGIAVAKDVWMLGAGLALVLDQLTDRRQTSSRRGRDASAVPVAVVRRRWRRG